MNDLSIIVVLWNCESYIEQFLGDLVCSLAGFRDCEVLLYDNASTDRTVSKVRSCISQCEASSIKLYTSEFNYGFSYGNNYLISRSIYQNVLLLNPDVFGFTAKFWDELQKNVYCYAADAAFVKLLNPDGTVQDCVGEFPSYRRAFKRFLHRSVTYDNDEPAIAVEVGIMAFMLTNKAVLHKVGLLDESYHMYSEDVDWCFRAHKAGCKLLYFPRLNLIHLGGASSKLRWKNVERQLKKYESEEIFINKNYVGVRRYLMLMLVKVKMFKVKVVSREKLVA